MNPMLFQNAKCNNGLSEACPENAELNVWEDKRSSRRRKFIAGIRCSFFNAEKRYQGVIRNLSSDGMYFESSVAFPIGANIFFTLTKVAFSGSDPESRTDLRSESLAQVVWCQPVKGKQGVYGIGVKYHKTVY